MNDLHGERPTSGQDGAPGAAGAGGSSQGLASRSRRGARASTLSGQASERDSQLRVALRKLSAQLGPGVEAHEARMQGLMRDGLISLVELNEGQRVWRAGDAAVTEVVCVSGLLKLVVPGDSGRIVRLVLAGELGGSNYLLTGGRHLGSLVAATHSVVLRVERAAIERWVADGPEAALGLLRYNTLMADRMQRQLCALTDGTVSARLARLLLLLVNRTSDYASRGLDLPLTQAELAGLIGARRETVARQLSTWRRQGLLSFERGGPWTVNVRALEREADAAEQTWCQPEPAELLRER